MHRLGLISSILLSFVVTAGCDQGVAGSGRSVSQSRELPAFQAVQASGAFALRVTQGTPQRVEITTDDNVISLVRTEVRDGILVLDTTERVRPTIHVAIATPNLDRLHLSGAANAELEALQGAALRIETSGAAKVRARGSVDALTVIGSGAMNLEGTELVAQTVDIELSGAGNAAVHAQKRLGVKISGAGKVVYSGDPPEVQQEISGAGTLAKK